MKTPVSSKQREREFHSKPVDCRAVAGQQQRSGRCVQAPSTEKAERRKLLKQYIQFLRPFRNRIAFNFLLALFVVGLDSLWPLGLKMMIDLISGSHSNSAIDARLPRLSLKQIGIVIVILLFLKQSFDSLRSYLTFA